MRLEAGAPDRFARMSRNRRVTIQHLTHVAVRLFDDRLEARARMSGDNRPARRIEHLFLLLQRGGDEVLISSRTEVFSTPALTTYGWTKPS